jgi:hypothetical protein
VNYLKLTTILISFLKLSSLFSQTGSISLDYFDIKQFNGNVYVDITLSEGNTCNGIIIQRSLDTIYFQNIAQFEGICGNTSSPTSYNFLDENPIINQTSYYRVKFGTNIYSEIIEILIIDSKDNEFQLRPHPANNETTLYFNNEPGFSYELTLFSIDGIKMRTLISSSNKFFINTSTFNNGFYIFSIKQGSTNYFINGQLIVRH